MQPKASLTILLGFALCLSSMAARAQETTQVHFVDSPYPPYSMGEEGGAPTGGVAVELVNELFKRLGAKLDIKMYPWKRTLKMAELGHADGITLLMRDEERERYLAFSDVLFEGRELFYYHSGRMAPPRWSSFVDLKPYKIGLVNGYTYGEDFIKAVETFSLQVEYDDSDEISLEKLLAGRIDLVLMDELVAKARIAGNDEMKKVLLAGPKAVTEYPYHVAFSLRSSARKLLPEVNRVISEMKADGTIDRALNPGR